LSEPGWSVPPGLERIGRHCLEKDPAQGFQNARRQYDASADGQRFIPNLTLEAQASVPITLVQNWTAKAPR
jgi:2-keto-4-pentenoate hydratase